METNTTEQPVQADVVVEETPVVEAPIVEVENSEALANVCPADPAEAAQCDSCQ